MEWLTFILSNSESLVLLATHLAALIAKSPIDRARKRRSTDSLEDIIER